LTDYLADTSFSYERNPDYWGYDERHPENQLPYADTLKVLYIPDQATRLAALRTDKADFTDEVDFQHAATLSESNPELLQAKIPYIMTNGIDLRTDLEPFNDIRVRKAMQMAIDRETIAANYYNGRVDPIPCGTINPSSKGYTKPYDEWPAELQAEYSYNPDEAKALLADAGYPNGFETTILFATHDDQGIVEIVKAQLLEIGIDAEIDARDSAAARALGASFDYELSWNRNTGSTASPSSVVTMSKSTHSQNFNRANDPAFDAICDELDAADNIADVKRLVTDLDMYVLEQHWGIRLFPINTYNIWQPFLKGYSGEALTRMGNPGGWLWARFWKE
jgi:peptide/nickel transport system substrate-binding protein